MRLSRLVPVLATGALLVASTSPVHAQSDPVEGVGTTTGELTLLGLDAGDLLTLDLLTDAGSANVDEASGPRRAAAQIAALAVESAATGVSQVLPLLQVESTGEPAQDSQGVTPIQNPILSGAIAPLELSALVDEGGATSLLSAGLADLDVLSGVLSLAGSSVDLGSTALAGDAAGSRGVAVDALTVLDLEALLELLGIPLADLSLDTLLGLLDGLGLLGQLEAVLGPLGVDIDGLSLAQVTTVLDTTLDTALDTVDDLLVGVDALEGVLTDLTSGIAQPVCDLTQPVLDLLGGLLGGDTGSSTSICSGVVTDVQGTISTVTAQLGTLTDQLEALLDQVLAVLDAPLDLLSGQALLSLDGLDVSVLTKATDDVATSSADVTGNLGALQVGELPALGALDLTAPTDQLNGLLAQAETLIGDVLAPIGGGVLSDLVSIRPMQEATSVEPTDAGGVVSTASFTGLDVQVLPEIGEVLALLEGLVGDPTSITGIIAGLPLDAAGVSSQALELPVSGAPAAVELNGLLATVTGGLPLLAVLEDGLGLQVATLSQRSTFTPVAASAPIAPGTPGTPGAPDAPASPAGPAAPSPTLPRTGSDDTLLLALAGAAVLAALGGRQLVRRSDTDA